MPNTGISKGKKKYSESILVKFYSNLTKRKIIDVVDLYELHFSYVEVGEEEKHQ